MELEAKINNEAVNVNLIQPVKIAAKGRIYRHPAGVTKPAG